MPSGTSEAGSKPKPFSIALSSDSSRRSTPTPSSQKTAPFGTRNLSSRSRKFGDHDSASEDEAEPAPEEVTGFDHQAGGAIITNKRVKTEKQPLIIKIERRNKWRDKLQAQTQSARRSLLPAEVQAQRQREANGTTGSTTEVEAPDVKFGLSYAEPSNDVAGEPAPQGDLKNNENGQHPVEQSLPAAEESEAKLSQDEVALQALIRESKGEAAESKRSDLVITARPKDNKASSAYDETKSFRRDIDSRPAPASLSAYNAVPVEEFGAALLRGMGWKEGQPVGRGSYGNTDIKPRVPERRAGEYLGVGAKDISGKGGNAEVELGAWGKAAMRKAKNDGEGLYTPVLMKSKKTGELITEDEFKGLSGKAKEKDGADDWKERRDRNLLKSSRDTDRDRDRDRDRRRHHDRDDRDDDRSSRDSRRRIESGSSADRDLDRDRDKDRYRHRKSHHDDRPDRESDREKDRNGSRHHQDRDRDRERESRRGRDREEERSRGYDSGRDKTRDRDRDRDRDRRRDYERGSR